MHLAVILATDPSLTDDLYSLCTVLAIAAAVPLIVGLLRLPIAEVVLLLAAGIIFGPFVLGWITVSEPIGLLSELGLGFLFFAAGMELERHAVQGRSGKLALIGWLTTVVLALITAGILERLGIIHDFIGVAIALTSTALGTLLPVLRDQGLLKTPFGTYFMGAGAIGEFGPVLAISILLSTKSPAMAIMTVLLFAAVAVVFAKVPEWFQRDRVMQLIERGHDTSAQTAVRLTVLLLVGLLAVSALFGLDLVLGAFVAGIIVRRFSSEEGGQVLQTKIVAVAFGIFIPIFFVISGANLDIDSVIANPKLLLLFLVLLLLVRGVPQFFIYRHAIPDARERTKFMLYVATALPIIVAVTSIELADGIMLPSVGAALVGAGALSVLVFPLIAQFIPSLKPPQTTRADATA